MVGLVRSTVHGALEAWTTYYRNSLNELLDGTADFAPIHDKAAELARGRVLDLGSCFGFLPLRLAGAGLDVIATDILPGTMRLLDAVAPVGPGVDTLVCDAAGVPVPDDSADTVTAIHLLEHVDHATGAAVLAEGPADRPCTRGGRGPVRGRGNRVSRAHPDFDLASLARSARRRGFVRGVRTPRRVADRRSRVTVDLV